MSDEIDELTRVQAVIEGLSSPTSREFVQATRSFSDGAIAGAAAQIASSGGGGGGGNWWETEATGPVTISPSDEATSTALLIGMGTDISQNFPYAIDVRDSAGNGIFEVDGHGDFSLFMRTPDAATFQLACDAGILIQALAATSALGFFGATPAAQPEVDALATGQSIVDALVALGLVTQAS